MWKTLTNYKTCKHWQSFFINYDVAFYMLSLSPFSWLLFSVAPSSIFPVSLHRASGTKYAFCSMQVPTTGFPLGCTETHQPLSPPHKTCFQFAIQCYLSRDIWTLTEDQGLNSKEWFSRNYSHQWQGKVFVVRGPLLGISPTLPPCKAALALEAFIFVCDKERVSGTGH